MSATLYESDGLGKVRGERGMMAVILGPVALVNRFGQGGGAVYGGGIRPALLPLPPALKT